MFRSSGVWSTSGFTLIGLIVTLTIMATVSGVAGFYYMQVLEERKVAIAKNELRTIATHVQAWLVNKGYPVITTTTLHFLVVDGKITGDETDDGSVAIYDPWGRPYALDPAEGVVYSLGPDDDTADSEFDNIRVPYSKMIDITAGNPTDYQEDNIPPTISPYGPTKIIPVKTKVYAEFKDHHGGAIDPNSVHMWIDSQDVLDLQSSSKGVVTSSMNAISYLTNGEFAQGVHTVVVQVQDGSGNIARREWTFEVDTQPIFVDISYPIQGGIYANAFQIQYEVRENTCVRWWLDWDELNIAGQDFIVPTSRNFTANYSVNPFSPSGQPGDHKRADLLPENVKDGLHYITLKCEDATGRINSAQSEIMMDNTTPTVYITQHPPGSTGNNPIILTTTIPCFKGWADDDMCIKTIEFTYKLWSAQTSGDPAVGDPLGPTTACPIDYRGDPPADWISLFNSASEEWSTTGDLKAVAGGYKNTTLPQDDFALIVEAVDLAGNRCSPVVTHFMIDMLAGGLHGLGFFDETYNPSGSEFDIHHMITGLTVGSLLPEEQAWAQTTGSVRFFCKQSDPASYWRVIIDDDSPYGSSNLVAFPSVPFDWTSTGPNTGPTGTARVSPDFSPLGDNNGEAYNSINRRGGAAPTVFPEGEYLVQASYHGIPGPPRTADTTMVIDNTRPKIEQLWYLDGGGLMVPFNNGAVITSFSAGAGKEVHFGGRAVDLPANGKVANAYFHVYEQATAEPVDVFSDWCRANQGKIYPSASGGWLSHPPTRVCSFGMALTDGAYAVNVGSNKFMMETTQDFGLDGDWTMRVMAVDGAGLTTFIARNFTVNIVGPVVEWLKVENGAPPVQFNAYDTGPREASLAERRLIVSFYVEDQQPLTSVQYTIYPAHMSAPTGTSLPINTSNNFHQETNLVLVTDSYGSEFASAPVSYTLRVWGTSAGVTGAAFEATMRFEFLMSLAIVAPNYAGVDSGARWLSAQEQTDVANYLFNGITAVENKVIYDKNGTCPDPAMLSYGFGGSPPNLADWMTAQSSSGTTDVLIVLDQAQEELVSGNRFIEYFNSSTNGSFPEDGDVIVWMGHYPFGSYMRPDGTVGYRNGADEDDQRMAFYNLMGCASNISDDNKDGIIIKTDADKTDYIHPDPGDALPDGNLYIPSLNTHKVEDFGCSHALKLGEKNDQGDTFKDGTAKVESTFTLKDHDKEVAAFCVRNPTSKGRFAAFFCYGTNAGGGSYVIDETVTPIDKILDDAPEHHKFDLPITENVIISDLKIRFDIAMDDVEDYNVWLEGPHASGESGKNSGGSRKIIINSDYSSSDKWDEGNAILPDDFPSDCIASFGHSDALTQFIGDTAEGIWTLHINADGGNTGDNSPKSLDKWGLIIAGTPCVTNAYVSGDVPTTVDNDTNWDDTDVTVGTNGTIVKVRAWVEWYGGGSYPGSRWNSKLELALQHPDTTQSLIWNGSDHGDWSYGIKQWFPDGSLPNAMDPFITKDAAGVWKLRARRDPDKSNWSADAVPGVNEFTLELTTLAGASTYREPVGPAPYVIREFVENYLLNKGHPDAAAKPIFYSADETHKNDGDPVGADEIDVYSYPYTDTTPWRNLTSDDGENAYIQGCSASGSKVFFVSKRLTGATTLYSSLSLFVSEGGSNTTLFECKASSADIASEDAVDVSRDGDAVFVTKNKPAPLSANKYSNEVAYLIESGSNAPLQLTTGVGANVHAALYPRISNNAKHITITSRTVYGNDAVSGVDSRPPFSPGTTYDDFSRTHIWRYSFDWINQEDRYKQGWITEDEGTHPSNDGLLLGINEWDNYDGLITNDGRSCVFSTKWSGETTMQVAFARQDGVKDWIRGYITRVSNGWAGGAGKVAIYDKGAGLPAIAFFTNNDFEGQKINPEDDWDGSGDNAHRCQGAPGGSVGDIRIAYLDGPNPDSTLRTLVEFDSGTDETKVGNIEWSKDGQELVFTAISKSFKCRAGDQGNWVQLPNQKEKWGVFRLRLGGLDEETETNVTITRCTPDLNADYNNDNGGLAMRAFIGR